MPLFLRFSTRAAIGSLRRSQDGGIQKKLDESEQEKAALLEKANADAKRMISEAKQSATALGEQKAQEAVAQAQTISTKPKKQRARSELP
jgi:cell division septum initiation protein DivIVA